MCYYSIRTKTKRRTRPRASPARRRASDPTLRDVAPAKHSASHDSSMLKRVLSQPNFSPQTNATQKFKTFRSFPQKIQTCPIRPT